MISARFFRRCRGLGTPVITVCCRSTLAGKSSKDIKGSLLDAALRHVPAEGWTPDAVTRGAKDLQYPEVVQGLFDDPGASLVQHFIRVSNAQLIAHIKKENDHLRDSKVDFPRFVTNSIKYRLQLNLPYMERMTEALSIATRPDQLPSSVNSLLTMCDDICYYGGDRSTNMSWYTKRASLAAVYAATELYMLQDRSLDYEETWQFMDRRIEDLKNVAQPARQAASAGRMIMDFAYSFYVVGRNALGANTDSRR